MSRFNHSLQWIAGMVVLAVMLGGCASSPKSDDEIVIERAQARWDAVAAWDLETAYTYFSPGFRSSHSLIDFGVSQRLRRVHYTSANYLEHSCEASRCLLKFKVGFKVNNPVPGASVFESASTIEDTWIKTDGQWWYLPKN